jgi:hypothetical protein
MSKIICDRCGKSQNGMIILTDQSGHSRQLCRDCHNEELAEAMGVENFKDFIKTYQAKDVDGELHVFQIQKEIFPMGIKWVANEVKNGGYQFRFYVKLEDDPRECLQRLYGMINKGLSIKYVQKEQMEGQIVYSLPKDKLVGRIEWDEDGGGMPKVIIDGKIYNWHQVGKMLMGYEGWNVVMKVHEMSEDED